VLARPLAQGLDVGEERLFGFLLGHDSLSRG
jgi:phage antirepressor YoqD-like protein